MKEEECKKNGSIKSLAHVSPEENEMKDQFNSQKGCKHSILMKKD
jgi:hypothetical protein